VARRFEKENNTREGNGALKKHTHQKTPNTKKNGGGPTIYFYAKFAPDVVGV